MFGSLTSGIVALGKSVRWPGFGEHKQRDILKVLGLEEPARELTLPAIARLGRRRSMARFSASRWVMVRDSMA